MKQKFKFRKYIKIGQKTISVNSPAFIIGEIGSNHNQSLNLAKELIDIAAEARIDAVKFQSLNFNQQYVPEKKFNYLKEVHSTIDLPEKWFKTLYTYAQRKNLIFLSSPTYFKAMDILEDIGVLGYKIASPITVGFGSLIEKIALTKKPIFMSTGYCTLPEIDRAVRIIQKAGNQNLILMHCIASYPLSPKFANLKFMAIIQKRYGTIVGFSDHTMSTSIPAIAVALGARVIEKHFTVSRKLNGPDHNFSLEPEELKEMVINIRDAEQSIGKEKRYLLSTERRFKEVIKMKLVANVDIPQSTILKKEHLIFKRASGGIEDFLLDKYIGKKTKRSIKRFSIIKANDFI